jgi:hypothetical protein
MRAMKLTEDVRVVQEGKLTTKVLVVRSERAGGGGVQWDVPTDVLPLAQRKLGSTFRLMSETWVPENDEELGQVGKHPPKFTVGA